MRADAVRARLHVTALIALLPMTAAPSLADVAIDEDGKLKISVDFRLRVEADWDSQTAAGEERDDRNRARARARVGLTYAPTPSLTFGIRVRTGSEGSQGSAYVTLFESVNDGAQDSSVDADKWYAAVGKGGGWAWGGRNDLPLWQQNEWLWDADATLAGLAGGWRLTSDKGRLDLTAGYFTLPDGVKRLLGNLAAGQIVYGRDGDRFGFTAAGSACAYYGEEGAQFLLDGNGARDYAIGAASLQGRILPASRWPVTVGVDIFHNAQDYSALDPDPFTVAHRDERDGWVAQGWVGRAKEGGEWLFGAYYARVETLALNASYAQDDWARWGNADQGASTDLKGWELRAVYAFTSRFKVTGRYYIAEAITSPQDGKRFRIDFGYDL